MKQPSADPCDHAFSHHDVWGHALALLRRHRVEDGERKVHLDIGCARGRIAGSLTVELGATYVGADVGADADEGGLESLQSRAFEAHSVPLAEEEPTYQALRQIVGDRRVGSISMLDTLEHLPNGDAVLRAIGRLAIEHAAFVVVSVPNVAHADIGLKLAFGRWDSTDTGLLDDTHVRLFNFDVFDRALRRAGLYTIADNDVRMVASDQHFPLTHSALCHGTQLNAYLGELRRGADRYGDVTHFVRICVSGPAAAEQAYLSPTDDGRRPFLSIVVRTQGKRPHTLDEVLTALAGQTDTDFEVLVLGHTLPLEQQKAVERILEDSPEWIRAKCRLLLVDEGNRTRPLNVGFADAKGDYIAILDDDDLPFGHWVETFRGLAEQMPGRLLRAVTVQQDVINVTIDGRLGLRAVGRPEKIYPPDFDYLAHLRRNQTPPVSVAFPRGVFHDLGVHFDESLTTTEDWDYIMRVAAIVGTASSPNITSVYRWWHRGESSRSRHAREEWDRNYSRILQKMDDALILFPPGTTRRIRDSLDSHGKNQLREVVSILNSTSWRITLPLRAFARLMGKPGPDFSRIWDLDGDQLAQLAATLRRSRSWRITAPLRRLRGG